MSQKPAARPSQIREYPKKDEFMGWLREEVRRRGGEEEVAALLDEMMLEDQLAALRKKRGVSQAQLAKIVGVSQPVIARIESGGVRNLTMGTIIRTASALGGSVEIRIKPKRGKTRKVRESA
jgi:DNA-binding XRE family transcriptional regulator